MMRSRVPLLRQMVGDALEMAKTIQFWSVFLGFLLGIGYSLLEKLFQRSAETSILDVMRTWEYHAIVTLIAVVLIFSVLFYFGEKDAKEKKEHNTEIFHKSINRLSVNVETLVKQVETLVG